MKLLSTVRNAYSNLMKPKDESARLGEKTPLPVRHLNFEFQKSNIDSHFYLGAEMASAYFHALSIFLTYGEELVIDTARHHRDFIKDPILKQRVTGLIGQEAMHSKIHEEYNEMLKDNRFPVDLYRKAAEVVFGYGFNRLPQSGKLSLMAAIEHFTAVLAEYMMHHEQHFFHTQDSKTRGIWMWHMLEESEHKDIAYDVFQSLSGNYFLRVAGFVPALITVLGLILVTGIAIPVFRKPAKLIDLAYWKDVKHSLNLLYGRKDGVYGSSLSHILEYFRPSFHPNDHDTSEHLEYYKHRLLNPVDGILAPYLVKEFVPAVRA